VYLTVSPNKGDKAVLAILAVLLAFLRCAAFFWLETLRTVRPRTILWDFDVSLCFTGSGPISF
jgi:hypothetical protein